MLQTYFEEESEKWLKQCLKCKHCYTIKSDADEIRCRLRSECRFEPYKENEDVTI